MTAEGKTKQPCYHVYSLRMRIQGCVSGERLRELKKNTDDRKCSVAYVLWLIFCRHGVIHTQSLQKLLLEDDVTKPEDMTGDIRSDASVAAGDAAWIQRTGSDSRRQHTFFCQTYPCTPKAEWTARPRPTGHRAPVAWNKKRFIYNTRLTQRVMSFNKNVLHHFLLKRG